MTSIPVAQPSLGHKELRNLTSCVKSSWISSQGQFIDRFESEFAHFCSTKYSVSTSNGTTALHLALLAIGIKKGDEVILPALTFVSCANTVAYAGASPVFVDIDESTWTIDPDLIEKQITKKTKAIMAVHLYGYPAQMDRLKQIANKHHLFLIEDAAEAHGAEFQHKRVGGIGQIGCFSFYGNKIITTGEGGMIVTNDQTLAKKITILKNHGSTSKGNYFHPVLGYNYRMTNIQAAIGLAQLQRINAFLRARKKIDGLYRKLLSTTTGIVLPPEDTEIKKGVCWTFSLRINQSFGKSAKEVRQYLQKKSIETRPFFVPLHKLPMYQSNDHFPIAERISSEGLSLPTFVGLSVKKIHFIAHEIGQARKA